MGKKSVAPSKRVNGSRRPSLGEREFAALLDQGAGMGVYIGAWTDSRIEQVRHLKHWIYVAINRIADKIAQQMPNVSMVKGHLSDTPRTSGVMTIGERRKALTPLQSHEHLEPVSNTHPLVNLLRDPNEPDTAYDLWYETILFLLLTGNAYWWLPPNGLNLPVANWVIPSHWMWPVVGKERIIEGYEVRPTEGNYLRKFIPAEDIIHFRRKNPISKIDGFSPLTAGAQWCDTQEMIDRSRWFSFRNGAFPGVAIEFDGKLQDPSDEDMRRIEAKFIARYTGEVRANKPLFLPPGLSLKKLSVSPQEMMYHESAEQVRDNILALFGVPAVVAGISKHMTYGSVRASWATFHDMTINPLLSFLSQVISEKLASRYDERLRVWWSDTTPADPAELEREIRTDLLAGAITPNELRALRGRKPFVNGGDSPIMMENQTKSPLSTRKMVIGKRRRIVIPTDLKNVG
jgi:HK97 family phage portal protein